MFSCCFQWSSCYLVNGQVTFAAIPTGHTPSSVDVIPKAIAPIAFTAKLLVATGLSQPTEVVDSNLPMDVTSQGEVWTSECGLLHDIACGTAFCQAVLGKRREVRTTFTDLHLYYVVCNSNRQQLSSSPGQKVGQKSIPLQKYSVLNLLEV